MCIWENEFMYKIKKQIKFDYNSDNFIDDNGQDIEWYFENKDVVIWVNFSCVARIDKREFY